MLNILAHKMRSPATIALKNLVSPASRTMSTMQKTYAGPNSYKESLSHFLDGAERGWFAKTIAFLKFWDDHPRNFAPSLERKSKVVNIPNCVMVSEEEDGLYYFIPVPGAKPGKVEFHRRGRYVDVLDTSYGGKDRVAELFLPEPEGEEYTDKDFYIKTNDGMAKFVVVGPYKGRAVFIKVTKE